MGLQDSLGKRLKVVSLPLRFVLRLQSDSTSVSMTSSPSDSVFLGKSSSLMRLFLKVQPSHVTEYGH